MKQKIRLTRAQAKVALSCARHVQTLRTRGTVPMNTEIPLDDIDSLIRSLEFDLKSRTERMRDLLAEIRDRLGNKDLHGRERDKFLTEIELMIGRGTYGR